MRNIYNLYEFSQYLTRKERGIWQTIAQFNQNITAGQLDAIEEYYEQYGVTDKVHDALRPVRVYQQFTSDAAGFVTFLSDYSHKIGSSFTVAGSAVNEITFVQESELPFSLKSQLRPVSNSAPIAVDTSNGFSIYPQSQQTGFYWYIKIPTAPLLVVTQAGRVITYDAVNSVQLSLNEIYWNNILAKSLRYVGIYMNEKDISAFANQYDQETK
jgi:hypothetical protein